QICMSVVTVLQSPDDLIKNQNELAVIVCSHNIQNYNQMLWYKQSQDMPGLKLMGYLYVDQNIEPEFTNKIKLEGDAKRNGTMTINNLKPQDSAVYFCAASLPH
uniref:Ig-like domain-containing protein n=1 Tax=Sinocyclocheilus rhinocerous TaxID=307959 RepID=A0A673GEJ2_9TELE